MNATPSKRAGSAARRSDAVQRAAAVPDSWSRHVRRVTANWPPFLSSGEEPSLSLLPWPDSYQFCSFCRAAYTESGRCSGRHARNTMESYRRFRWKRPTWLLAVNYFYCKSWKPVTHFQLKYVRNYGNSFFFKPNESIPFNSRRYL